MASVQNCSLLQKDSTDERNGLHARPARRRVKLGAAATGLLQDEAMRARMIRKWSAISRTDLRESSRILALETIRV